MIPEKSSHTETYLSDPDVVFMLEFKEGNKASFEKLMVKYFPRILNFIYRFVKNREVAEDLTQEVIFRALQAKSRYDPGRAGLISWVRGIHRRERLHQYERNDRSH